jgi:hypothetical protein
MSASNSVRDRDLERQGRRIGHPGLRFLLIGALLAIPGIVLIVIGHGWSVGVGIAVLLLASGPIVVGIGLLSSAAVSRWAARHRLFA